MAQLPHLLFFRCFGLALLFWLNILTAQSQRLPENISYERTTIPGTIRSSQVVDIIQDKLGLIWLAGDGLFRYDGFSFKHYHELSDGSILNPRDIHGLLYDSATNRVLLATHQFGIVAYDYKTDKLHSLHALNEKPVINQLAKTADNKIWAISYSSGLFYLENDTLKEQASAKEMLMYPSCVIGVGNQLYIGALGQIQVWENSELSAKIKLSWHGADLPLFTLPTALYPDREGNLWIGTEKQGVLVYSLKKKDFIKYFPPTQAPFYSRISKIIQDRDGLIWIITKANGIAVYSPGEDRLMRSVKDPFSSQSLSSDNCFSILEDRDGMLWIGAIGDLNKYDRQQVKFNHVYHHPLNKLSLTDNMVRGMYEDPDGKVWIGTDGGYINILDFDKESSQYIKLKLPHDSANFVPMYFYPLNKGIVLIGTSSGLLQYERATGKISPFKALWRLTREKIIRQIIRHENNLYFICNGHLFVHDLISNETQEYKTAGDSRARNITAIYKDDNHRIWVGCSKGISRFDPVSKTFYFTAFHPLLNITEGALILVLSIQQAGDKLYVGTFNGGMWEVDISNADAIPPPRSYLDKDGLPSNTIYAALPDDQKNLWLSTNNGLAKFNPETKQFISFLTSEGLQGEEFNRLSYLKTKNGELLFGGINGINFFYPKEIPVTEDHYDPLPLSITAQNPLSSDSAITELIPSNKELVFRHDQNFISIQFFVPNYKLPKQYKIFYKLENFEKEWRPVLNENIALYTHLPSGAFTFMLKTAGVNGKESIVKLPFTISSPYWTAWWFIFLVVCIVAFLVLTIIRSYITRAQNDRLRLETLLRLRTAEIERSREELQVLNQKKDLIFSILSHDLRSPLTTLKGFLGYLIDNAHELTVDELKRHAVNIRNSVTNSLDLIDNTLFWSLSQMGNIQYTPTNFSLRQLLEKLLGLYQLTADKKRIPLTVICQENIILYGDENMIYVSLRNLVSNALKFTREGNPVTITCERKEDFAEIYVVDKGIGMSPDYLKKILSLDQPMIKKGTSNEKGTGVGLLLCKNFIETNKGELKISSVEHEGTTFTVRLPMAIAATEAAFISHT